MNIIINEQRELLNEAFGRGIVSEELTRKAFEQGVSINLLWSAAGAGLAAIHRELGMCVADLDTALKGERKFPYLKDYITGYNAAILQTKIGVQG